MGVTSAACPSAARSRQPMRTSGEAASIVFTVKASPVCWATMSTVCGSLKRTRSMALPSRDHGAAVTSIEMLSGVTAVNFTFPAVAIPAGKAMGNGAACVVFCCSMAC